MADRNQMAAAMLEAQMKMLAPDYGLQLAPIKRRILDRDYAVILECQPAEFFSALMSVVCDLQSQLEVSKTS